ncbi:uncharacterized protein LOC111674300, partial [Orussus abietinus]|uniref:uncharacterized protein LOC111674300 n=1 Tax=Orussus abietinus TaxID=222816 RepID=UPI000C716279
GLPPDPAASSSSETAESTGTVRDEEEESRDIREASATDSPDEEQRREPDSRYFSDAPELAVPRRFSASRANEADHRREVPGGARSSLDFRSIEDTRSIGLDCDRLDANTPRDHYMVPTRDRDQDPDGNSLSLFNPQFLPNFNDMIVCVARCDPREARPRYFPNINREDEDEKELHVLEKAACQGFDVNSYVADLEFQRSGTPVPGSILDSKNTNADVYLRKCLDLRNTNRPGQGFDREKENLVALRKRLEESTRKLNCNSQDYRSQFQKNTARCRARKPAKGITPKPV